MAYDIIILFQNFQFDTEIIMTLPTVKTYAYFLLFMSVSITVFFWKLLVRLMAIFITSFYNCIFMLFRDSFPDFPCSCQLKLRLWRLESLKTPKPMSLTVSVCVWIKQKNGHISVFNVFSYLSEVMKMVLMSLISFIYFGPLKGHRIRTPRLGAHACRSQGA